MMTKKTLFFLLFCLSIQVLPAQKKVILEKIRCRSIKGPVMAYWQNEELRKIFARQLNSFLVKYHQTVLADTAKLNIQVLDENTISSEPNVFSSKGDTANFHMYIDIFENTSEGFFSHTPNASEDSALMNRVKSVFQLQFILLKKDSLLFNNTLDILVTAGNTAGIGIVSNTVALTPRGFVEMLTAGMNILMDPQNELVQIEVKVAPAFVADNYIITKTMQWSRIYASTTKNISSYDYNNDREMIRSSEAIYEQIILKGKKADKLPRAIEEAIRNTEHFSQSDYVFLRQDTRDVIRNKNYLLKLLVQVDPEKHFLNSAFLLTNFVPGNVHFLFNEKDTVAIFTIEKAVSDPVKKIYINKISNGFDSSSFVSLDAGQQELPVIYDYVVKGKINKQNFSIKCSGFRNTIKEIYLDDTLICIAQGKFNPEKFVVFDASLSSEVLNQLLMIGFNCFFE